MMETEKIPRIYVVFNGPLGMSPGKMASQSFQVCQRLYDEISEKGSRHWRLINMWELHTTTITRIAKTPTMWERVKAEVEGVVMVDEGYTEVEPESETCFASWPMLIADVPKILSNAKVPLL